MSKSDPLESAKALADGASNSNAAPELAAVERVVRAFRSAGTEASTTSPKPQFTWRHLEVHEAIGQGGFGTVYRAWDPMLRRNVALKLARVNGPSSHASVIGEARLLAKLRHPNILAIHGADHDDDRAGIWCDLLAGETLEAFLDREGTLDVDAILGLAAPLTDAISLIHQRGLVHGDIKPSNIMLLPSGDPVLMDFGTARDAEQMRDSDTGSPLVMAPEQFEGDESNATSDIYSFGAVLYRCAAGRYPVEASDFDALVQTHARAHPPNFELIPSRLRSLVEATLSREPPQRPSAGHVAHQIREIDQAPQRRRRRRIVAGVIAGLLVALLIAVASAWRAERAESLALERQAAAQSALNFVEQTLGAPRRFEQGANVRMVDAIGQASRRLTSDPPASDYVRARLHRLLGRTYWSLDRYSEAQDEFRNAVSLYEKGAAPCCEELVAALTWQARNDLALGQIETALATINELENRPDLTAEQNVELLRVRGAIEFDRGGLQESLAYRRQAQILARRTLGYEDLEAAADLVATLRALGQLDDAEALARRVMDESRGAQGVGAAMLTTRHELSTILLQKGRYADAVELIQENLNLMDKIEPALSGNRIAANVNLAAALAELGQPDDALRVAEVGFEDATQLFGSDHLNTLRATNNVGARLADLDRHAEAAGFFRESWKGLDARFGPKHLDTLIARGNFAEAMLFSGDVAEARDVAEANQAALIDALGAEHVVTLYFADILGVAEARSGNVETGISNLRENLDAKQQVLGGENPMTWDTAAYLVDVLSLAKRQDEADALAQDVVAALSRLLGSDHPKTLAMRAKLDP